MYTERTMQAARAETQPACSDGTGQLPSCGALAFPYVAVQGKDPVRYDDQEALRQGTLFPGLDLPFHKELRSRFPQVDGALLELMALDFAIDELGLYLTTHPNDQQALELYWSYIRLGREGQMFVYEKKLQYPVKIKNTNPRLASLIISQYGGPYSIRL